MSSYFYFCYYKFFTDYLNSTAKLPPSTTTIKPLLKQDSESMEGSGQYGDEDDTEN